MPTQQMRPLISSLRAVAAGLGALVIFGVLLACGGGSNAFSGPPILETCDDVARATTRGGSLPSSPSNGARVERVVDGDTMVLANGERVRYIGVDTPERDERFYEEATALNRRLVEGQRVWLMRDTSDEDPFGRLLRYVLAGDILVNAELAREGLAEAKQYEPDVRFASCFEALVQEAQQANRGMWAR